MKKVSIGNESVYIAAVYVQTQEEYYGDDILKLEFKAALNEKYC